MKLLFVTACFYKNTDPIKMLLNSAYTLRIPMNYYGLGTAYTPMSAKIDKLVDSLRSAGDVGYSHAFYTDGADAFLLRGEEEIKEAYERQGAPPCLISAERECAPITDIEDRFPAREDYRYPCAGGFMGEIPYLIKALTGLGKYLDDPEIECNDQAYWQIDIIRHNAAMIDSECLVFQTMSGGADTHLTWDGEYFNNVTQTHPCVLHFNGRVEGIEQWYEEWSQSQDGK